MYFLSRQSFAAENVKSAIVTNILEYFKNVQNAGKNLSLKESEKTSIETFVMIAKKKV